MHTLNDMSSSEEMAASMAHHHHHHHPYEEAPEYGLGATNSNGLSNYGEPPPAEFYLSSSGAIHDSKYTSQYPGHKFANNRSSPSTYFGNRLDEAIQSDARFTGRYAANELATVIDNYSVQYEQSFQTVPSSIPPTPSPEQWPTELSPHANHTANLATPPHSTHMAHQLNFGSPLHGRDHVSLSKISNLHSGNAHPGNLFHQSPIIDGKPVIQAAVLAGEYPKA